MPLEGRNQGNITTRGQKATQAANIALGAGWGDSTKAVTAGSSDHFGSVAITAVTGGGLAQATATVTITLEKPFAAAPAGVIVTMSNDNSAATNLQPVITTNDGTTLAFTSSTIPVNTKIYTFTWFIPSRS